MSGAQPEHRPAPWAAGGNDDAAAMGPDAVSPTAPRRDTTEQLPAPAAGQTPNGPREPGAEGAGTADTAGTDAAVRERPGAASSAVTAILTGVLVGAVATAMHGSIWYMDGWWLPWGLVFSGALLLCAGVWCGTSTRRVWAAAVPGLVTYLIAWAMAYLRQGSALVATQWSAPIGIVGILWFVVVFVVVMVSVIVTGRWLVRRRAR